MQANSQPDRQARARPESSRQAWEIGEASTPRDTANTLSARLGNWPAQLEPSKLGEKENGQWERKQASRRADSKAGMPLA